MPDFYPMPSFPTLAVRDLERSVAWYRDELGFEVVFQMPGPSGRSLVHLRWAKYADLMLRPGAVDGARGAGVTLSYRVEGDIDALAERAAASGARILAAIADRPWNARDFTVADPDGYALTFTKGPINATLGIDEVVRRVVGDGA